MVADFIDRVRSYPVVNSAVSQANNYYTWAKDQHQYIKSAADFTEHGIKRVAGSTQPLLNRFEERVNSLDQLACRQLDRLESNYPVICEPTDQVVEKSCDYYNNSVRPKVQFVLSPVTSAVATVRNARDSTVAMASNAKNYGLEKYRRMIHSKFGQAGLHRLDELIASIDNYVDHYLPEQAGKGQQEGQAADGDEECDSADCAEPSESVRRAVLVGRKMRQRMYSRAARSMLRLSQPISDKVQEVRTEFWDRVEEIDSQQEGPAGPVESEDRTVITATKIYLHRAQVLSMAGLQVTNSHLPDQVQQLTAKISVQTERGVKEFRVSLASFFDFLQHNRMIEHWFNDVDDELEDDKEQTKTQEAKKLEENKAENEADETKTDESSSTESTPTKAADSSSDNVNANN